MRDTGPFHLETLEDPVSGRDGSNETGCNGVAVKVHVRIGVKDL